MSDFFHEKYSEIILYKQKSLVKYQSSVKNFRTAMQKKLNQQNDENIISDEFVKNLYNTVNELKNLQLKKMGLKANSSFYFDNDFSNILDSQPSPTPKEIQNEFSQSSESHKKLSVSDAFDNNQIECSQTLESIQQPSSTTSLKKEQT